MGKTGTTQWVQIKGAKGQLRLVPAKEGEFKKPGPNQRFKTGINLKKLDAAADPRGGQRRGGRGGRGGSRGGPRGGRGRPGEGEETLVRCRVQRAKVSVVGAKSRATR
ncbi:MAG TPA: DUF5350 domain-containing protein [Methanoregulaceae archaeon]|nr:DUF5350 domain-containing protein [Methanoregulaceae archaeon]HOV67777.1 DUF5350 domain-containing protein [Methanoregulaceae archaeon]HQJ88168.1 DUF5350 domain-containing protein [Methanoregulaceae archaeon]